ncbi:putative membrane protein [Arthrobacter sp. CAN_A212]|uniref:YidH family protein n=1 Tax=Arthrobacter sp. CAN_A212 TaxID=2787719 RepID=UPI0018C923FF
MAAPPEKPPRRSSLSQWLLRGGTDPDPRFTLANERTFLAWIRTALALLAGGIAVEAFTVDLFDPALRKGIAILLLLLAMLIAAAASGRWLTVERAMRHGLPLPLPLLAPVLSVGATVVVAIVVVVVFLRPA